jgi:hypothetical protein
MTTLQAKFIKTRKLEKKQFIIILYVLVSLLTNHCGIYRLISILLVFFFLLTDQLKLDFNSLILSYKIPMLLFLRATQIFTKINMLKLNLPKGCDKTTTTKSTSTT